MYLAFYRTFRPATFDDVVRQEHIVRILKNQISSGKVGHAYLFCGPRGTGKTTIAKIFARAINCENPQDGSPCGKCPTCKALADGASLDISEIDAASNNGVDEMRDLREKIQYPPVSCKYKVYIIDEVHMLTPSAFNAVLKTLEEPPKHAVFILATTEPQKIPATILSRCMRFDFKLIPQKDLESLVKSVYSRTGKEYEDSAISAIARAGAGSARDSLSIADMCASYSSGKLTYADVNAVLGSADFAQIAEICASILDENASSALSGVELVLSTGKSVGVLVKDLLTLLNNCAIVKVCKNAREIVNLPGETYDIIESLAKRCDGHKLLRVTEIIAKAESDMRYAVSPRITLETAVFKSATPSSDYNIDALIGRIASLERKIEENAVKAVSDGDKNTENKPAATDAAAVGRKSKVVELKRGVPLLQEEEEAGPFSVNEAVQPMLWESGNAGGVPKQSNLGEGEKRSVFGKFIKALRTTHKNAVLFTLCMDLGNFFEGDKIVFTTDSEAVYKALVRAENSKIIADILAEQGVFQHEVKLTASGENEYDRALGELKKNFDGVDIDIK